jgi:hypothetical protein
VKETKQKGTQDKMCMAVISDLCNDVVKYVRGGDTDITFGRLVFFFSDAESNSYRRDY